MKLKKFSGELKRPFQLLLGRTFLSFDSVHFFQLHMKTGSQVFDGIRKAKPDMLS